MRYLPDEDRRIELWRKAIFLFRKFREIEGPFHMAGVDQFLIEQKIVGLRGSKPDIIGWRVGREGKTDLPIVFELTLDSGKSKKDQIERYAGITPEMISPIGIETDSGPTVIIGTPTKYQFDDDCCNLILGDVLTSVGSSLIVDSNLRNAIDEADGALDLVHIPEIHFTIVPESHGRELRRGISSVIIQQFRPISSEEGFSAEEITEECLDFIAGHIEKKERKALTKKVDRELRALSELLKDYIYVEDGRYHLTDKGKRVHSNPKSMEAVANTIMSWSNQKRIEDFDTQES